MKPEWYDQPKPVSIHVPADRIKMSPLGNEVSITLEIDGEKCNVIVPAIALDKHHLTIPAIQVGEIENKVILSFPPTSLGTSTCSIPKSQIHSLLAQEAK